MSSDGRGSRRPDDELQALMGEMVARGLVTAAVAASGRPGHLERFGAAGTTRRVGGRRVRLDDRFDLASVSKPFAATLALALDRRGDLALGTRVGEIWGAEVAPRLADRTLESLLRHRSGLAAWTPLYRRCRSAASSIRYLLSGEALAARRERYSDLDVILWGLSVERALGSDYQTLLERRVLRPLGLGGVVRAPGDRPSVVESRLGNDRERNLAAEQGIAVGRRRREPPGAAQDGNARFLGRHAAHAGLFGSAVALLGLASEWLVPSRVLSVRAVTAALEGGRSFALGWMRRTLRGSGGPALAPSAFGHIGFTGCSLWVDPQRQRILVLMAHRTSSDVDLAPWRRRFHRMVLGRRA